MHNVLRAARALAVVALTGPIIFVSLGAGTALAAGNRLTVSQLAADLRAGLQTRRVPSHLAPSLASAKDDKPLIAKNGCETSIEGVTSKLCAYGDTSSPTTVVLFGDSHAGAWFPALDLISKQRHWRLVILVKSGCPAEAVDLVRFGRPYTACPQWRRSAEDQIARLQPALVIMASSQYINGARPLAGVPKGYGGTWQDGVAATFAFLHKSATHVIYISDVPQLRQPAPDCVSKHMSDVRPCTVSRRAGIRYPKITADEFKLAASDQIKSIDPTSWFCTPTRCPVIVGNVLIYRDAQHMVPQWSEFLAPVLSDAITQVMPGALTSAP